jgi:hypothetical protein
MICTACGTENTAGRKFCSECGTVPFWLAVAQVEYAEALIAGGRAAEGEQFLAEARPVFERLEVGPWLERTGRAAEPGAVEAV